MKLLSKYMAQAIATVLITFPVTSIIALMMTMGTLAEMLGILLALLQEATETLGGRLEAALMAQQQKAAARRGEYLAQKMTDREEIPAGTMTDREERAAAETE